MKNMSKFNSNKFIILILKLMLLFSTFTLFKIGDISYFIVFQLIFCLVSIILYKSISMVHSKLLYLYFAEMFLSMLSGIIWNFSESYKKAAIFMSLLLLLTLISSMYISRLIKNNPQYVNVITDMIRIALIIQCCWIIIQFLIHATTGIDINEFVFVKMLHTTDDASFVRAWVWYPAGLCHHPAVLAPLFVMGICLFKNPIGKALVTVASVLCGNSTAMLGVIAVIIYEVASNLNKKNIIKKIKKKQLIIFTIGIIGLFFLVFKTNITDGIVERTNHLIERIALGAESDSSTKAHIQYYLDYIDIARKSNLFQLLFGCGEGCSGMWASLMYDRYSSLGNWSIECDFINILVNRGIVGFMLYYMFLIQIALRGRKINAKYTIVMAVIIFQGLTYNVQWNYILMIEIFMYCAICYKIDIFDNRVLNYRKE